MRLSSRWACSTAKKGMQSWLGGALADSEGLDTLRADAGSTAQSWLRAYAPKNLTGSCQIASCGRVGLDVTRAFLPTTRERTASQCGCKPRDAKVDDRKLQRCKRFVCGEDRQGPIVNHRPLFLVRRSPPAVFCIPSSAARCRWPSLALLRPPSALHCVVSAMQCVWACTRAAVVASWLPAPVVYIIPRCLVHSAKQK